MTSSKIEERAKEVQARLDAYLRVLRETPTDASRRRLAWDALQLALADIDPHNEER